jgi:tetratricopeptide (TPR) repeat protein
VEPFLQVLSARLLQSLSTDLQRAWLRRLAAIAFPFRRSLALDIARLSPSVTVSDVDWNYLASQVLDQSGPDRYTVPLLLRPLLKSDTQQPSEKTILIASARHVFRNAGASKQINFWDFHGAILALVMAQRYEEAAMWFSLSLASSLEVGSYKLFEILFMVLNSDPVQAQIKDPFARFLLLLAEIQMRLLNEPTPDYVRIVEILRRIRILPRVRITPNGFLHIRMTVHAVIATIHVRRLKDKGTFSRRDGRRAFAPLQTALRIAVTQNEESFVSFLLNQYEHLYTLHKEPDLELLKRAILAATAATSEISADALVSIYAQFVIAKKYADPALELCTRHSREFQDAARGDAYFACEHAIATILHDRFAKHQEARERIVAACTQALQLGASSHVVARSELLVGDSYWANKDYASAAEHYHRVLEGAFEDEALNQWVRERLADSLIFNKEFDQAPTYLLTTIRKSHATLSHEDKAKLQARLVYTYGLKHELSKAVIACQGLSAIARASDSASTDLLSATLCDWLLQFFEYSDPVVPKSSVQIRDSSALSEKYTDEQIAVWKAGAPLFARASILLGILFELLQKPPRAEFFYRKALALTQAQPTASPGPGGGWYFALRICRTQILRRRFPEAATSFVAAVADFFASRRSETTTATEAGAAFAAFTFIEPALAPLSDAELGEFFAALDGHFKDKPQVRAWILFRQSEVLFERLLVQAAKPRLLEAEILAADHPDYETLLTIRHKKLFLRFDQVYANQVHWVQDVLEHGLLLATNDSLAPSREAFGKNVFALSDRIQNGPMRAAALKISAYGERWKQNPFLYSLLALWCASRQFRLRFATMDQIENYLRSSQNGLQEQDFR